MFNLDQIDKPVNLAEGEWVGDVPGYPGARFLVRSNTYKPFEAAHNRLLRSFGKNVRNANSTPEYREKAGALLAEHILLGWENAVSKGGKPAEYDRELAETILTAVDDRGIGQAFRSAIDYCASVVADRHLGIAEDIAGN